MCSASHLALIGQRDCDEPAPGRSSPAATSRAALVEELEPAVRGARARGRDRDAALAEHALESRARIIGVTILGCDPARFGLGPVGAVAEMPGGFTFEPRENVIVSEVYYAFELLLSPNEPLITVSRMAIYRPRYGALTQAPN